MRVWFSGPRIGPIRPGVSFGPEDFTARSGIRFGQRTVNAVPATNMSGDFVYVISGGPTHVKVGMSSDPSRRLSDLQTASPTMLELAFTVPTYGNAFEIEQEAHRILDAHRLCGEWFAVSKEMAIAAIYAAADRTGCQIARPGEPEPTAFSAPLQIWPQTTGGKIFFVFCVLWLMNIVQKMLGL